MAPEPGLADVSVLPPQPVPVAQPGASTGSFRWDCGRNLERHRNSDNVIASPGQRGAAHHVHDYVGNLTTDAYSTNDTLASAPTTCKNGDLSTYYWPVLRIGEPHAGPIQQPVSVELSLHGSPAGKVLPLPRFLRASTGDARGGAHVRPTWTCAGLTDRRTTEYPACASGRIVRVFDFPSCWDGRRTDSADHRSHLAFPAPDGACPAGMFPVARLRLAVAYELPGGEPFSIDTFPEQRGKARTDHGDHVNVMPDELMAQAVACINSGRAC